MDGVLDPGEECDEEGQTEACDADCTFAVCGDGVLNTQAGEVCDDGNTDEGDGCDGLCQNVTAVCGDGLVELPETCDDGNVADGDGCDASCQLEP